MVSNKIDRRTFCRSVGAGMGASMLLGKQSSIGTTEKGKRPNLVYVFPDQMRFSAMGCMGNTCVKTPNLDKLAGQGLLLTNAFSSTPICSPYRAQLMTGRYSHVNGVITNDRKLPESETCIAEVLKEQGYKTGYIGKWHLEGGRSRRVWPDPDDPRHEGYVPKGAARQGFDYWAAIECSHRYFKACYFKDTPEKIPIEGYEPDYQTDLAIEYMKSHRNEPFCLFVGYGPPHNPYDPPEKFNIYDPEKIPLRPNVPEEFKDKARRDIANYYGLVTSLDHNVGRLMNTIDELGITENTIFCFTSDHGDMLYSQGETLKQKPWEESIHIPFIMRYPDRIKAGQQKDVLFNSVDVMPTLLSLCGAPVPDKVQGKNLSDVLLGKSNKEPDSAYFAITGAGKNTGLHAPWRGIRTKEWMYAWSVALEERDWVLYNIKKDPYQLHNRINDPECQEIKEKLKKRLVQWRKDIGDNIDLEAFLEKERKRRTSSKDWTPDPDDITEIAFEFKDSDEGWKASRDVTPFQIVNNCLVTEITGPRPTFAYNDCNIESSRYSKVKIRMCSTAGNYVQFFWTAPGLKRMREHDRVTVPIKGDGQFHEYVVNVGNSLLWRDKIITGLRLIIVGIHEYPAALHIDYIRGENDTH